MTTKTATWAHNAGGIWSGTSNWTGTKVPNSTAYTALIDATGPGYTITFGPTYSIGALTMNSAGAVLSFGGIGTGKAGTDTLKAGVTKLLAGTIDILNRGAVLQAGDGLTTSAGTTIDIGNGASLTYSNATVAGVIDLSGGATGKASAALRVNGTIEASGGLGTVAWSKGKLSGTGTLEANGATLKLTATLTASTAFRFDIANSASSIVDFTGTIGTNSKIGTVTFAGANGELEYSGRGAHITFAIAGLNAGASKTIPTNFIDLGSPNLTIKSGGTGKGATGSVTLSNNDVLTLFGLTGYGAGGWAAEAIAAAGGGSTEIFLANVCYAAGTSILTTRGEKPVEQLLPGDVAITLVGDRRESKPILWIGRRRVGIAAHPHPETAAPIRILRNAFAADVPHRDLLVSPEHGILADNKLICARQLVNGTTIRQDTSLATVEYFHVELASHAILLAEGLPAESYLDTGNRGFFANAQAPYVLHPDMTDQTGHTDRAEGSCREFVWDEASVRPVWQRLATRAAALGQPVASTGATAATDLRIVAGGRVLHPVQVWNRLHAFVLPKGTIDVRILSRAGVPTDTCPWLEDRRRLGIYVRRIVLRDAGGVRDISLDHPALCHGWWAIERDEPALHRWTNGDAWLPLPLIEGAALLEIHADNGGMSYAVNTMERRVA